MINKYKYHALKTVDGYLGMDTYSTQTFIFQDERLAKIYCDEYANAKEVVPCYIFKQKDMDTLLECLELISDSCDKAMIAWGKNPIPHCDDYAEIAQDLDYVRNTIKVIL